VNRNFVDIFERNSIFGSPNSPFYQNILQNHGINIFGVHGTLNALDSKEELSCSFNSIILHFVWIIHKAIDNLY
jgi:hypothetical protein